MTLNIVSFGVEIEGHFDSYREFYNEIRNKVIDLDDSTDGSVKGFPDDHEIRGRFAIEDFKYYEDFVKLLFDMKFMQNYSCGNHVHVAFNYPIKAYETAVFHPKFFRDFREEYIKYAENKAPRYYDRMENHYSALYGVSGNYEQNMRYDRFCGLNVLPAYRRHRTFEIRIMPYNLTAKEHIENTKWILKTMNILIRRYENAEIEDSGILRNHILYLVGRWGKPRFYDTSKVEKTAYEEGHRFDSRIDI